MERRKFIKNFSIALAGFPAVQSFSSNRRKIIVSDKFISNRPPANERKFISEAVEQKIVEVKNNIADEEIAWMFENCFPNTLDTTVDFNIEDGKPDTFVITGDIDAMWLRDSTAQVWPYLEFIYEDEKLRSLTMGVINRQVDSILIDSYANAFNKTAEGSEWANDITEMKPELHERKWEVDSLCYPVRLAYKYWKNTSDTTPFDKKWLRAMRLVVDTFIEQQRKTGRGNYRFMRETAVATDTVPGWGWGNPVKPNGLICSIFRPSDDSTIYPFLIPSNLFAIKALEYLSEMSEAIFNEHKFSQKCQKLSAEIKDAVSEYGIKHHLNFGKIYAYEVDGFGNALFIDDANVPSLLSLPYLDLAEVNDEVYQNTRRFILSKNNPWYFESENVRGIGSPHTGIGNIWHIALLMQGLTSSDDEEIIGILKMLKKTHAGTGFMHESFDKNDPSIFSRKWFAWANSLFGEFVLKLYSDQPEIFNYIDK